MYFLFILPFLPFPVIHALPHIQLNSSNSGLVVSSASNSGSGKKVLQRGVYMLVVLLVVSIILLPTEKK